jgi:DNA-binding transcriptional ArsR family regulator
VTYTANLPVFSRDVCGYVPIDVIVAHPRIRILRLLSRFDWLSGYEITEHLGVQWSPQIRNAYATHLSRMRKAGLLIARPCRPWVRGETTGDAHGGGPDYQISPRARADLPKLIRRASRP